LVPAGKDRPACGNAASRRLIGVPYRTKENVARYATVVPVPARYFLLQRGACMTVAPAPKTLRLLVVEDEYFVAEELAHAFEDRGASVVGPAPTIRDALTLIAQQPLDGAILDINLHGEMVYPVADELASRGIPFVFATGYDKTVLPSRFSTIKLCEKPADPNLVLDSLFDFEAG
jgi:CheY-like chemotaxis protein